VSLLHIGGQIGGTRLEAIVLLVTTLSVIWLHITLLGLFKSRSGFRRSGLPRRPLRRRERQLLDEDVDGGAELGALGEDGVDRVVLQLVDE
jgi:hypothetical protein